MQKMPISKLLQYSLLIIGIIMLTTKKVLGSKTKTKYNFNGIEYKTNYPTLKVIPLKSTKITFKDSISIIKSICPIGLQLQVFAIVFAEARKDSVKKEFYGINNNYGGVQTDSGVWGGTASNLFSGQVPKIDSGKVARSFAAFNSASDFFQFVCTRLNAKGFTNAEGKDWAKLYITKWWGMPLKDSDIIRLESIFNSAKKRFIV